MNYEEKLQNVLSICLSIRNKPGFGKVSLPPCIFSIDEVHDWEFDSMVTVRMVVYCDNMGFLIHPLCLFPDIFREKYLEGMVAFFYMTYGDIDDTTLAQLMEKQNVREGLLDHFMDSIGLLQQDAGKLDHKNE